MLPPFVFTVVTMSFHCVAGPLPQRPSVVQILRGMTTNEMVAQILGNVNIARGKGTGGGGNKGKKGRRRKKRR